MKKISYYIILFFSIFNFSSLVYAETKEACQIIDWKPEVIENYLKNLRKVTSNIVSQSSNNWNWNSSISKSKSEVVRLYNSLVSWWNYIVEWDFYLYEPIFNNLPKEIIRDVKSISNELKKLDNIMSKLAKKWTLKKEIEIEKVCNWLPNCSNKLEKISWEALIQVIWSTKNILEIIQRAWASDKNNVKLCNNVLFIDKNSCLSIYKIYSNAKQECQDDKYEKKIENISLNFEYADKWIAEWKEAWALLIWANSKKAEYDELEKKLLRDELSRQWIWANQAEQILKNLDEYNWAWWYTKNNNPISNISKTIVNAIDPENKDELVAFKESIAEIFKKKTIKTVTIADLTDLTKKKQIENISKFNIDKIYKEQLPLAQMEDLDTSEIVWKILRMNNSLSISINTLEDTIPISKKVCNAQWNWLWQCSY
jgi:hypothetical protein